MRKKRWLSFDYRPYDGFDPEPYFSFLGRIQRGEITAKVENSVERRWKRQAVKDGIISGTESKTQRSWRLNWAKANRFLRILYHWGYINGYRMTCGGEISMNIFYRYTAPRARTGMTWGRFSNLQNHVDRTYPSVITSEVSREEYSNDKRLEDVDYIYERVRPTHSPTHMHDAVLTKLIHDSWDEDGQFFAGTVRQNRRRWDEMRIFRAKLQIGESIGGGIKDGPWNAKIRLERWDILCHWESRETKIAAIRANRPTLRRKRKSL